MESFVKKFPLKRFNDMEDWEMYINTLQRMKLVKYNKVFQVTFSVITNILFLGLFFFVFHWKWYTLPIILLFNDLFLYGCDYIKFRLFPRLRYNKLMAEEEKKAAKLLKEKEEFEQKKRHVLEKHRCDTIEDMRELVTCLRTEVLPNFPDGMEDAFDTDLSKMDKLLDEVTKHTNVTSILHPIFNIYIWDVLAIVDNIKDFEKFTDEYGIYKNRLIDVLEKLGTYIDRQIENIVSGKHIDLEVCINTLENALNGGINSEEIG